MRASRSEYPCSSSSHEPHQELILNTASIKNHSAPEGIQHYLSKQVRFDLVIQLLDDMLRKRELNQAL